MSIYRVSSEDARPEDILAPSFAQRIGIARLAAADGAAPVFTFTAGICSRCKAPCASQMLSINSGDVGKSEALCAGCLGRDREARRPDWFAAEERAGR